ncbi:MAG: hypothetical protein OEV42_05935 [Deltaproteobacteria bacterium]|nr:hypothetical protein [Deltaproteobacteria bacterium]
MDNKAIKKPVSETFEASDSFKGLPEVTDIHYDLWLLRITLRFQEIDNPVYVTFDAPKGFRVLEEGDLLEFWSNDSRPKGWLWVVKSGGWYDLEKNRSGFVSGVTGVYSEYLILGESECVSVITDNEPVITEPKP